MHEFDLTHGDDELREEKNSTEMIKFDFAVKIAYLQILFYAGRSANLEKLFRERCLIFTHSD